MFYSKYNLIVIGKRSSDIKEFRNGCAVFMATVSETTDLDMCCCHYGDNALSQRHETST